MSGLSATPGKIIQGYSRVSEISEREQNITYMNATGAPLFIDFTVQITNTTAVFETSDDGISWPYSYPLGYSQTHTFSVSVNAGEFYRLRRVSNNATTLTIRKWDETRYE